jgi:pyrroline-5-carboxylate reductase
MDLCFVGGGNMASALIGGLMDGNLPITRLHVIEPQSAAQENLKNKFLVQAKKRGIQFTTHSADAPDSWAANPGSAWVVLAVKPQQMREACEKAPVNLRSLLSKASILSVVAGISIDAISSWCGNAQVVRAMPNTPALVRQGITGLFANNAISKEKREEANQLMHAVGQTVWVEDESLMDAVTALSGSGPAYVFLFIEALSQAGVRLGLNPKQSETLAIETLQGALALLKASAESPAQLRERVTSKGGTTAAALASLEQAGFVKIVEEALKAARDRGAEMSREFS